MEGIKLLKVKFVDFWDNFNPQDNFFYNMLSMHYQVVLSDDPDFLFFSVFGDENLKYDCVKIFYTGENQSPDFNLTDYAIGFERLDFGDRYFRMPICYLYTSDFKKMEAKHLQDYSDALDRGFCSFVYSNNKASQKRDLFYDTLSKYKQVASGGRYRNNVGGPVKDKCAFQNKYKFCIAFENCSHPGYVTEKLVQAFASGTVPIYYGDPCITETFNPDSFINVNDFGSFEDVVNEVIRLDSDDSAYVSMLKSPALRDPEKDSHESVNSALESFLNQIILQGPQQAKRYNRDYWMKRYIDKRRSLIKSYNHSVPGLCMKLYSSTLWKWRSKNKLVWRIDRFFKNISSR